MNDRVREKKASDNRQRRKKGKKTQERKADGEVHNEGQNITRLMRRHVYTPPILKRSEGGRNVLHCILMKMGSKTMGYVLEALPETR